ncbi:MAG: hypothetical protein ABIU87_04345 [Ornithinibacter sp.]
MTISQSPPTQPARQSTPSAARPDVDARSSLVGRPFVMQRSPGTGTVAGMALHPFELLYLLVLAIVPAFVLYFVIRLAVRHGVMDANRRLGPGQDSSI